MFFVVINLMKRYLAAGKVVEVMFHMRVSPSIVAAGDF